MLQLIPFVKGFQNKRRTRVGLNGQSKAEFEKKRKQKMFLIQLLSHEVTLCFAMTKGQTQN